MGNHLLRSWLIFSSSSLMQTLHQLIGKLVIFWVTLMSLPLKFIYFGQKILFGETKRCRKLSQIPQMVNHIKLLGRCQKYRGISFGRVEPWVLELSIIMPNYKLFAKTKLG